ncbi:MAG: DUF4932 domain-containing protein [Chryseobacterium sp.]|jgi:hypothetical protein|uniref:DUF4932 domain-containing protein n=1 Tax=Chryseobacterium sp. TaxID=1871047 RepID=UPI002838D960|nr:DUF4932 domain-containing protein [Chryseobacterium sp.]MDR2237874.1 DUF4932 domain-containing protein [Chryseobacterium sp.]
MNKIIFLIIMVFSSGMFGQKSRLHISIDERVETVYSIAFLADYSLINSHDHLYKQALKEKYAALKNHKAVALFDSLSNKKGFNGYKIVDWALQFDRFPALNIINKPAETYDFVKNDRNNLLGDFKKELILFHQDSLFQEYRKEMQEADQKVIRQVENSPHIQELPSYLEQYYGGKLNSYHLILSPFLHTGGFNSEMITPNGQKQVFALVGPNGEIDFYPYFDRDYIETDMILHEFGHSFVNPITQKNEKEIEILKEKYYNKTLQKTGKQQGYGNWYDVFNELLLRATTLRITETHFGKDKSRELLEFEKSAGFGLVEDIAVILKEYEQNRKKYPTFEKFFPVLIEKMR